MTQQTLLQTAVNTALRQADETPPPDNEGMLRQVRALSGVAQQAARDCLKGRRASDEMRTRKNTSGQ
jgi:hypothetical protein